MTFQERLQHDLQEAMRAKDQLRLAVLRMMKTAIKLKETETMKPLEELECLQVLSTLIKQRKDSVEQFTKGGRLDLAEKESQEIKIIETYRPAAVPPEEVEQTVSRVIEELAAKTMKDMGHVMKQVMAQFAGRPVDGKAVNALVRSKLGG